MSLYSVTDKASVLLSVLTDDAKHEMHRHALGEAGSRRYTATILRDLIARVRELEAERAGLRAALEQYANPGYYGFLLDFVGRQTDPTKKAREALAGPIPTPTEPQS